MSMLEKQAAAATLLSSIRNSAYAFIESYVMPNRGSDDGKGGLDAWWFCQKPLRWPSFGYASAEIALKKLSRISLLLPQSNLSTRPLARRMAS